MDAVTRRQDDVIHSQRLRLAFEEGALGGEPLHGSLDLDRTAKNTVGQGVVHHRMLPEDAVFGSQLVGTVVEALLDGSLAEEAYEPVGQPVEEEVEEARLVAGVERLTSWTDASYHPGATTRA